MRRSLGFDYPHELSHIVNVPRYSRAYEDYPCHRTYTSVDNYCRFSDLLMVFTFGVQMYLDGNSAC